MQASASRACSVCASRLPSLRRLLPLSQLHPLSNSVVLPASHSHSFSARYVAAPAAAAGQRLPAARKRRAAPGPAPLDAQLDQPVVILGIDPDSTGAIAVLQWGPATQRKSDGAPASLADCTVDVHDMPMMTVKLGTRNKRQADAAAIGVLMQTLLPALPLNQAVVRILLEQPIPNPLNGKQSWWSSGFSYGVWNGVLAMQGLPTQTISARRWKGDMHLLGKGKEGSRQLALVLFPQAAHFLKRKMDHGRAEAMLLAAWASGIEVPESVFATVLDGSGESADDNKEEEVFAEPALQAVR